MTTQERIARLESLLARVRRNAQSRPSGAARAELGGVVQAAAPQRELVSPPARPQIIETRPEPARAEAPPQAARPPVVTPQPAVPVGTAASSGPMRREPMPSVEVVSDEQIEDFDVIEEEELLVEIASVPAAAAAAPPISSDIDFEEEEDEEEAPASAPRPAVSLETALEGATKEYEAEPPIKTPPPESGRQPLTAPPAGGREGELAGAADIDALLEADLSGTPISKASAAGGPTMEQLGETVELGASETVEDLELDEVMVAEPAALAPDDLEAPLPGPQIGGKYDASLKPPVSAVQDLEQHRRERVEPPPPPPHAPPPARAEPAPAPAPVRPEVIARPAPPPGVTPAAYTPPSPPARLDTFVALLDSSLSLRA